MDHITSSELRQRRESEGLTFERLALKSGIASIALSAFERGIGQLSEQQHRALAQALSGDSEELTTTTKLNLQSTLNSNSIRRFCWNARPCRREMECDYCWSRKSEFIRCQIAFFFGQWGWEKFATLSLIGLDANPHCGLKTIAAFRKQLHPRLFKGELYFSLIALAPSFSGWVPHFHMLGTGSITKSFFNDVIELIPENAWNGSRPNLNIKPITNIDGLGSYLMEQNLRPTLSHRPRGLRLMTASRGFLTGKPKSLNHLLLLESL